MYIIEVRKNFLYLQLFAHIVFAGILYFWHLESSLSLLFLLSIWFIGSYVYLFVKEIQYAPDFHPYIILILSSIQFVGFNGLNNLFSILDGENLRFGIYPINKYITEGMFFVSLQHFLLFVGYYFIERKYTKEDVINSNLFFKITTSEIPYYKWAVYSYLTVWLFRCVDYVFPLKAIGSILNNFATFGQVLPLTLLVFSMVRDSGWRKPIYFHWFIVIIEIFLTLDSGMKENILRNLIPYGIFLLIQYKSGYLHLNASFVSKLIIIFVFVLATFSYISVFRDISIREKKAWSEISVSQALTEYVNYLAKQGRYAKSSDMKTETGIDYLMSRAGSIGCNAWSINYAQTKQSQPQYLYYCSVGVIPRILWPSKPNVRVGGMMYRLATGNEYIWNESRGKNTASVSLGFIGSCYFSLGLIGAIAIPLFIGFFCDFYWRFLKRRLYDNLLAIWAFFALVALYLKDCESLQDCGMIFFAWSCVYMLLIKYVFKTN